MSNSTKMRTQRFAAILVMTTSLVAVGQHSVAQAAPVAPAPSAPAIDPGHQPSPKPATPNVRPGRSTSKAPSAAAVRPTGGTWTPWGIIFKLASQIMNGQYSCKVAKCANA